MLKNKNTFFLVFFCAFIFEALAQPSNNDCGSASDLGTLLINIKTCANGQTNINSTSDIPYITLKNCGGIGGDLASPAKDVWYKLKSDKGDQLLVEITGTLANPQVALWDGNSCDKLLGMGCATGSGNSLTYSFTGLTSTKYVTGNTYYLQIQGSTSVEEGNFDLCLTTSTNANTCLVVSEMNATPPPTYGAYQQSTNVEFCYKIWGFSQLTKDDAINDFIHGIAPSFGTGWDIGTFTVTKTSTSAGSGKWGFYTSVPTPSNGNINGFFYDSPDPTALDGNSTNNFGDGTAGPWEFCWKISTKNLGSCSEGQDLSIEIFNFADGETGFLSDNVCVNDPNYIFSSHSLCCESPTILSQENVTCFGLSDGSVKVSGTGVTPFTYKWNTGATTQAFNNLSAGSYTVTATDVRGCVSNSMITITEPSVITLTISSTPATCGSNDGTASVIASNGTPGYSYSWSSGGTAATKTNLTVGTYTVTVSDQNNCKKTATVSVTTSESVSTSSSNVKCNGGSDGSASVAVSGGSPPFTYRWSNSATAASISNLIVGSYTVSIFDKNSCRINISSFTITQPNTLTLTMSSDASCPDQNTGSASVVVSGGTSPYTKFKWSTGSGGTTILGLAAGNYTITITDKNNCKAFNSITVNKSPNMNIQISKSDISCVTEDDGVAKVSVNGGTLPYQYSWSRGTSSVDSVINLTAGFISVIVTDNEGCYQTDTITINKPDTLKIESKKTDVTTCGGNDGTATGSGFGGTPPYTYLWNNGLTGAAIGGLSSGAFTVTVMDSRGCIKMDTIFINDSASAQIFLKGITKPSCYKGSDGTATISTSGGVPPLSYSWSNGNTTITASGLSAGIYFVVVEGADTCQSTMIVQIDHTTSVQNDLQRSHVSCFSGTDAWIAIQGNGGNPGYTYSWSTGSKDSIITGLSAGTYTYTVADVNNCLLTSSATITQPTLLTLAMDSIDITCNGDNDGAAIALAGGGTTPYTYIWSNGITVSTNQGLAEGMYSVILSDAKGCTKIDSTFINNPPALSSAIIDTNHTSCFGGNDGSAKVTQFGGTAPYTYSWSPKGGSSATGTKLSKNNYTVTITDKNGCKTTSSITITEPSTSISLFITYTLNPTCGNADGEAAVSATGGTPGYTYSWGTTPTQTDSLATALVGETIFTVVVSDLNSCTETIGVELQSELRSKTFNTDVSCYGGSDGTARISAMSGTPPFTYAWAPSVSTDSAALNIPAGNYIVQISDVNCAANRLITINQPPLYKVDIISQSNVSCKNGSDGTSSASAYGGTPGYTYSWNNNDNDSIINALFAGTYIVTAFDAKNCPALDTIEILEPDLLLLYTSQTNVSCFGGSDGTAKVSVAGGTPPYSYKWTTTSTVSTISNLSIGTYTVTVIDTKNCRTITSVTLTQPNPLTGSITDSTNVSCFGGSDGTAIVTPAQGTAPYIFEWKTSPVQTDSSASNLSITPTDVEITDAEGCKLTVTITLQQPTAIVINTQNIVYVSCNGLSDGSISVSAGEGTPPFQYRWSTNPEQVDSFAQNLTANNYTATVIDAQSCTTTSVITITEPLTLLFNTMDTVNVSCKNGINGSATVNPTGGTTPYSYLWSTVNTDKTNSNLSAGMYTVIVTDIQNCQNTDTVNITEPETLFAYIISKKDITCYEGSDGQTVASASGGTLPYFYKWSSNGTDSVENNLSIGIYTITIIDSKNCEDTNNIQLFQPNPILVTPKTSADTICISQTATIIAFPSGGNGGYTYKWSTGETINTLFASPIISTSYIITITDSLGCTEDSTILIPVYDSLKVIATTDDALICQGESTILRASASGGNGHFTYNWLDGTSGISNQAKIKVTPDQTTTYILTLSDDCGTPIVTDEVTVNILSIQFEPDEAAGCPPLQVQFQDLSNSDSTNTWDWDFGDGNTSVEQNPLYNYKYTGIYNVSLSIKTQQGCVSTKIIPAMVEVYDAPEASFALNPSSTTTITSIQFTDKSERHTKLLWDFGDGFIDSSNYYPQHAFDDTGNYTITLVVYNELGCTDTLRHSVYIGPEFIFYVPNAFSPNGDGLNDNFHGVGVGIAKFKMYIFDKWGNEVFITDNPKTQWDGKANTGNEISQNSIFIYLIEIKDYFGIDHRYIGHVTLVR